MSGKLLSSDRFVICRRSRSAEENPSFRSWVWQWCNEPFALPRHAFTSELLLLAFLTAASGIARPIR